MTLFIALFSCLNIGYANTPLINYSQSTCSVLFSLSRSANLYFNQEIEQLNSQIKRHNVRFVDLNNWQKEPPFIAVSGRERNQLRAKYQLEHSINQAVLINKQGQLISRYTGSVTVVNVLLDCQKL